METDPLKPKQTRRRYIPSAEDRELVLILVGLNRRYEDIAVLIKNPATGRPINVKTLERHFRHELQSRGAFTKLGVDAFSALERLVKEAHWGATQFVLNLMGLKPDDVGELTIKARGALQRGMEIRFIGPDGKSSELLDVTPESHDLNLKASPVPDPQPAPLPKPAMIRYGGAQSNGHPTEPAPVATPMASRWKYYKDHTGWMRKDMTDPDGLWDVCDHGPEGENT
jgi:hypothetical protein